jgi:hypothetical protein
MINLRVVGLLILKISRLSIGSQLNPGGADLTRKKPVKRLAFFFY